MPLGDALPPMLDKIQTEIASDTVGPAEKWRLRQRAELVGRLLTASQRADGEAAGTPV